MHGERGHRLKNTLAMVQAIASQTLRNAAAPGAYEAFSGRLHGLARAHDILLQETWASLFIRAIIEWGLAAHADARRFVLDGPDVRLCAQAGLSLSLIFHEIATNSLKYGSLSAPEGRVLLSWRTSVSEGGEVFRLT